MKVLLQGPWRFLFMPPLLPILLFGFFVEGFWSFANIRTLLEAISADGLIVIGMTIVMIAGGFDLSVGAVLALGGVAGVTLIPSLGVYGAMAAAATFGTAAGLANGALVTFLRLNPFIATLAMIFMVLVACLVLAAVVMHSRAKGRHIYALGADERAARMSGLPVNALKLQCYAISGLLAGLAGYWIAARLGTGSPIIGDATPLTAAAAALIGGASLRGGEGSIFGAFLGLLFVGCLMNLMLLLNIPSYFQRMTIGGLLLTLVIAQGSLHRVWQR
jgi:ribose transport system permease protein